MSFNHGDLVPVPGAAAPPQPRRSFWVPVGVPAEPQVLDACLAVFEGDLGHMRELSPRLLWEVACICRPPWSPEVVRLLREAMLRSFREPATKAPEASEALSAARLLAGEGDGGKPKGCPLYTTDAADEERGVGLRGVRRQKNKKT